jgi:hypothetical protein
MCVFDLLVWFDSTTLCFHARSLDSKHNLFGNCMVEARNVKGPIHPHLPLNPQSILPRAPFVEFLMCFCEDKNTSLEEDNAHVLHHQCQEPRVPFTHMPRASQNPMMSGAPPTPTSPTSANTTNHFDLPPLTHPMPWCR